MPSVKKNIIANAAGQAWTSAVGFLLVPIYIHFMGMEAYGLLGFLISFQAVVGTLELGLSTTANREVARCAAQPESTEIRSIVQTLLCIYIGVGIAIALAVGLAADWMAVDWVRSAGLSTHTVALCIAIFGLILGLRWPVALYTGVLRGMQKQVLVNAIAVSVLTARGIGTVILLAFVAPSLVMLLWWHLIVALVEVAAFSYAAIKPLPRRVDAPFFSTAALRACWTFSWRVGAISIFAVALKQADKMLMTRLLPLDQVGYYMVASQAVLAVSVVVGPILVAVYPRLASLHFAADEQSLAKLYHHSSQLVSFVAAPLAAFIMFFSFDLLAVWTQSDAAALNAHLALSILAFAALFNAPMQISYILQLATGKEWIALVNNAVALLCFTPLIYVLVSRWGMVGGACAWALYNLLYYLLIPYWTHRHVLEGHRRRWVFSDTLPFMLTAVLAFGAAFWLASATPQVSLKLLYVIAAFMLYGAVLFGMHEPMRKYLQQYTRSLTA